MLAVATAARRVAVAGWVAAEMAGVRVVEEMAAARGAAKEVAVTAAAAMEAAVKEAADRAVAEKGVESLVGAFSAEQTSNLLVALT